MDFALIFLTGFLGSMHCVGMCGAIVTAYSTQDGFHDQNTRGKWNPLVKHLAYNGGRVFSYIVIGALLGGVGGGFGALQIAGDWFSTAVGVLLVGSGIWMLRIFPGTGFTQTIAGKDQKNSSLVSFYNKTYGILLSSPSIESKFYIGLLTPLIPCGLLYSVFLMAAASGNAVNGAATMALFGTGIVPSLILVGFVSTFARFRLRVLGDKLAAITVVLMGVMMLLRGLGLPLPWMMMGATHHHM